MIVLATLLHLSAAIFLPSPLKDTGHQNFENLVNVSHLHDFLDHLDQDSTFNYTGSDAEELAQLKEMFELSRMDQIFFQPGIAIGNDDVYDVNQKAGIEREMYEGDIILTDEQLKIMESLTKGGNATRSKRQAIKDAWRGWGSNPTVPYSFAADYPKDRVAIVEAGMKFWSDNTCVSFRSATLADRIRLEVKDDRGCWSRIGKTGERRQPLSIPAGCLDVGSVAHELAHTLGVEHTQSRTDRNKYVLIDEDNIQRGATHNFNIDLNTVNHDIPYEFGSAMHYGAGDFARNPRRPVLYARKGYEMYQHGMMGRLPTFYDIMLVNKMYNCYANCPKTIKCANGGVVDVRNCKQCKCAFGWTGGYCKKRPNGTKKLSAKANEQKFQVQMGKQGAKAATVITSKFFVIKAPAGKRVELTPSYEGSWWTNDCGTMGSIIQFKTDPRYAGVQICDFRVKYSPIVSEKNVVVIEVYTRGGLTQTTFIYRSV